MGEKLFKKIEILLKVRKRISQNQSYFFFLQNSNPSNIDAKMAKNRKKKKKKGILNGKGQPPPPPHDSILHK